MHNLRGMQFDVCAVLVETVFSQGRNFLSLWEGPSPPPKKKMGLSLSPPNDGLSPPMLVRKGIKVEEKSDSIRILMAP